ncbi:hypothetical protein KUTeg_018873 [Tegillarca granosa]|uniref:Uncharacterized protein n=1 Tax=Tegillarca granosa TaxID=220873 RepID=A0ABQ9EEZ8_TEGGR|nr:hypothetical protein KUTeg_018873 [Tegillarca granosa]
MVTFQSKNILITFDYFNLHFTQKRPKIWKSDVEHAMIIQVITNKVKLGNQTALRNAPALMHNRADMNVMHCKCPQLDLPKECHWEAPKAGKCCRQPVCPPPYYIPNYPDE